MMSDKEYSYGVQRELDLIISNAYSTGKEITLGQADFIRKRAFNLKKEGMRYQPINPRTKARQIDKCWEKRARQLKK